MAEYSPIMRPRRIKSQQHSCCFFKIFHKLGPLDDPPEISCKNLARIACIRQYLQESYKNGVILQLQKSLASFLKDSCKETSDLLNRHFLQEK